MSDNTGAVIGALAIGGIGLLALGGGGNGGGPASA